MLVGLPSPQFRLTHNSAPYHWDSPSMGNSGHVPGHQERWNKISRIVHYSSTIDYTCVCSCILTPSCWKYIWQIAHNHALTGYLYRAKMSRMNFHLNPWIFASGISSWMRLVRYINLKSTRWNYDSCSALEVLHWPKPPLTNDEFLNHITQSDALENQMVPPIECGKCSNWSNCWWSSPISKCYHVEILANTSIILHGTEQHMSVPDKYK
jgi:hypothetical protein